MAASLLAENREPPLLAQVQYIDFPYLVLLRLNCCCFRGVNLSAVVVCSKVHSVPSSCFYTGCSVILSPVSSVFSHKNTSLLGRIMAKQLVAGL
jgi:hypothetical protein